MNTFTAKSFLSRPRAVRALLIAGALFAMDLAASANAGTTYAYTSNDYASCGGTYCTGGPYALSVTFVTTLTGNALNNLSFTDISGTITSYKFTDGSGLTLDNSNNSSGSRYIEISTNASGKIVAWFVGAYTVSANTQMQTNWQSPYSFIPGADFSETTPSFLGNYGFIPSDPGIWVSTTPAPTRLKPAAGSGLTQTFTFAFTNSSGWQNLGVLDVLINSVIDGRQACYFALVPSGASSGSIYLVDDAGNAGGPFAGGFVLPGSGIATNSQCTLSASGGSISTSGNNLTLTLSLAFAPSFAGNKVFFMSARDTGSGNSGWQALGTWGEPPTFPTGPAVGGVSPARSNTMDQTYTFTFTDTYGWQDLSVLDVLIYSAIDGISACYVAYVPSGATTGSLYLVDDAGDAGGPFAGSFVVPGGGSAQNSQCTVNGTGTSATASGNTLTLNLQISFNSSFAGNQVFYLGARSNTQTSNWQAVGSVTVP